MAKIDITKTELVWPGKYNEEGTLREVPKVNLPFQVIETVNESRATREVQKVTSLGLFDVYDGKEGDTFEAGWRNKIIWGDNLLVMGSLLEKFAGKIDLIYIDPPFATGSDFSFTTEIGERGVELLKEQSAIEEKAYRDTWGSGTSSYVNMMYERLAVMRTLLSPNGSMLVHFDYRVSGIIRSLLDEVFGGDRLVSEIIWYYTNKYGANSNAFDVFHNNILFYSKNKAFTYNPIRVPVKEPRKQPYRKWNKELGKNEWQRDSQGNYIYVESTDKELGDVWEIPVINPMALERTGYATQKPEALLNVVISALSNSGDLVADFFCGSGTTLAVAEKLGRRWIGCDLGRWGVHVTRKRLLGIENCRPFEVLNLGKYERQYGKGRFCCLRAGDHLYGRFCFTFAPPSSRRPYFHTRASQIGADGLSTHSRGLLDLSQRPSAETIPVVPRL